MRVARHEITDSCGRAGGVFKAQLSLAKLPISDFRRLCNPLGTEQASRFSTATVLQALGVAAADSSPEEHGVSIELQRLAVLSVLTHRPGYRAAAQHPLLHQH